MHANGLPVQDFRAVFGTLWLGANEAHECLTDVTNRIQAEPALAAAPDLLALAKLAEDAAAMLRRRLERERTGGLL